MNVIVPRGGIDTTIDSACDLLELPFLACSAVHSSMSHPLGICHVFSLRGLTAFCHGAFSVSASSQFSRSRSRGSGW